MNQQEREQLNLFLDQLGQVRATNKDAEAEVLIREACQRQPDAAYLLVQRAMQLDQVLQQTQAQAAQLRAELDQARASSPGGSSSGASSSSFLNETNSWGRHAVPAAQPARQEQQGQVQAPRAAAPGFSPSPWGSGLLGNIATTAAGVVAGSFLFHGIESMMGNHGGATGNALASAGIGDKPVYDGLFSKQGNDDPSSNDDFSDGTDSGFDSGFDSGGDSGGDA